MTTAPNTWIRVPVGEGSDSWSTFGRTRKVLAVAHSVTSIARLLDVLTVFENDTRVHVLFTRIAASAFDDGVADALTELGARTLPWKQAVGTRFDLAIAASHSGDLHEITAPIVLMPHGIGYNKYLRTQNTEHRTQNTEHRTQNTEHRTQNTEHRTVYGLAPEQLLHRGRVIPSALVLSHDEQLRRLRASCPPAVPVARVAGDVCFDRIGASLPWRAYFRSRLGVRAGQRLVVVSSTWGANSTLGRHPELPARLLAELPADEYRVALVAHPNIRAGHGAWQIRSWLADARRAGLLVIPPLEGWRAAVVAADCVLGDHGSVGLYGAAHGRATMFATYAADETDPETPMAMLAARAPRLDHDAPLRPQVDAAITGADPAFAAYLAEHAVAGQGEAASRHRALFYELLGLPKPASPARSLPVPPAAPEPAGWGYGRPALLVAARTDGPGEHPVIGVERVPAIVADLRTRPLRDVHLLVEDTETDQSLRDVAAVLVRRADEPGATAGLTAREVLNRNPRCRVVADIDSGRCAVWTRGGGPTAFDPLGEADAALCASAALALGEAPYPPELTIGIGARRLNVEVSRSRG